MGRLKDIGHEAVDGCRGCLAELGGELIVALACCGLIALGWWGWTTAPYVTVAIGAGILLLAAFGVLAYMKGVRGTGLIQGIVVTGLAAAAVVAVVLAYLPNCACLR